MPGKLNISKVKAGRDIHQQAVGDEVDLNIEGASAERDIKQGLDVKPQESSINLTGFGSARGRFAVLVLAALLVVIVVIKYFVSR